eukprot:GILJ01004722.1.p1 GENE.GILJ01004722.1~~GILJ01004722.1.p1  ORF type:complete len:220 (-),score=34.08 GILJ01004722.1:235-894(-)
MFSLRLRPAVLKSGARGPVCFSTSTSQSTVGATPRESDSTSFGSTVETAESRRDEQIATKFSEEGPESSPPEPGVDTSSDRSAALKRASAVLLLGGCAAFAATQMWFNAYRQRFEVVQDVGSSASPAAKASFQSEFEMLASVSESELRAVKNIKQEELAFVRAKSESIRRFESGSFQTPTLLLLEQRKQLLKQDVDRHDKLIKQKLKLLQDSKQPQSAV